MSCDADEFADELAELGRHTRGKGCVYINKLEDVDLKVLERICQTAYSNAKDFDASK